MDGVPEELAREALRLAAVNAIQNNICNQAGDVMKAQDLREKSVEELNAELLNLLREQFNLRMQAATGQLQQTHTLKAVRRDIARVKTVLTEKAGA